MLLESEGEEMTAEINPRTLQEPTLNMAAYWKNRSNGNINARSISPYAIILYCGANGKYPVIGKGTWIGHYTVIDGSGGLEIGENCDVSCGVHVYTHSTHLRCVGMGVKQIGFTRIGNSVFIGPNSVIAHGSTIGDRAIIGALSYVAPNTQIPSGEVWAGIPARKLR